MSLTCLLALGLTLSSPAAPAPEKKKVEDDPAKLIIGLWSITKSDAGEVKGEIRFTKDGVLTVTLKIGCMEVKSEGTYKVDGKKITYSINQCGVAVKTETLTIKKLTEKELVTVDPDDKVEEFKRVLEK